MLDIQDVQLAYIIPRGNRRQESAPEISRRPFSSRSRPDSWFQLTLFWSTISKSFILND
jgi:hypothetical protein